MPLIAQQQIPEFTLGIVIGLLLFVGMIFCFTAAWFFLANRAKVTKSILPRYEPRHSVPWTGLDLMAIVLFYVFMLVTIPRLLFGPPTIGEQPERDGGPRIEQPAAPQTQEVKKTTVHPLAQLLKDKDPKILLLCFLVGVVIVPIFEEFFFRVLFTGWLLAVERRWRRKWGRFRIPRAVLPIGITSLIFASLHFRSESPEIKETNLVLSMGILAAVSIVTFVFSIAWINIRHGACLRDFGWDASKWQEDFGTGAIAYFAIALPIYALQVFLGNVLPEGFAPDPIVLFFFAVVLSTLYFRTSRILPSIVMHMMLNAGSLSLAWALM
jgi:membrane protease YdiL (CAAX protease family)